MASRRNPRPVQPRRKDEREYNAAIRRAYINPIFARLRARLAQAVSANQAWYVMEEVFRGVAAQPVAGVPVDLIEVNLERMRGYHRARIISTFRSALKLDIRPLLTEPFIDVFMKQKVSDNVDLIKTIPPRAHDGLKARLGSLLQEAPFDQNLVMRALRDEYGSTGYNVRRLTRDQTSKTIAGLTEARHAQLGIQGYQWLTAQDDRVRPTHRDNDRKWFRWDSPPQPTGNPGTDIQCRCVAVPAITEADRARLMASAPKA